MIIVMRIIMRIITLSKVLGRKGRSTLSVVEKTSNLNLGVCARARTSFSTAATALITARWVGVILQIAQRLCV